MLFSRVPYKQIGQYYDFIKSRSVQLEIYVSGRVFDNTSSSEIAEKLLEIKDLSGKMTLHGPFMDLSPGAMDDKVKQITHLRFQQVLDLAEAIRPVSVVLHSGYEKWRFDHNVGRWLKSCLPLWKEVAERAEKSGTTVAIENIFEEEPTSLAELVEKIGSPKVGVCFDAGHFNLFSKHPLTYWIETLGPRIRELHLHDNHGDRDTHGAVGSGTFDFRSLFKLLQGRKDIVMTVEATSPEATITSFERIRAYLSGPSS